MRRTFLILLWCSVALLPVQAFAADVSIFILCDPPDLIIDPDPAVVSVGDTVTWLVSASVPFCVDGAAAARLSFPGANPLGGVFPETVPVAGAGAAHPVAGPPGLYKYDLEILDAAGAVVLTLDPFVQVLQPSVLAVPTLSPLGYLLLALLVGSAGVLLLLRRR